MGLMGTRKVWRRGVWAAALLVALLGLGYGLLPWYLPTGWIGSRVAGELSEQLGREVSIGRVSVGWGRGVEVSAVRVGRRGGYGEGDLARVGSLQTAFSPWRLVRGQVGRVEVGEAEVWLVGDEGGWNVDDLAAAGEGGAFDVRVRGARVHVVRGRGQGEASGKATFEMEDCVVRCEAGGGLSWSVSGRQQAGRPGRLSSRGRLGPAAGAGGERGQEVVFEADGVDVGALDAAGWAAMVWGDEAGLSEGEVGELLGRLGATGALLWCEGRLAAEPNGLMRLAGDVRLAGGADGGVGLAGEAVEASASGRYDPVTGVAVVESLEVEAGRAGAAVSGWYDPRGAAGETAEVRVLSARAEGRWLGQVCEGLGLAAAGAFFGASEGQVAARGQVRVDDREVRGQWVVDGSGWGVQERRLRKGVGERLTVRGVLRANRDRGEVVLGPVVAVWGANEAEVEASVGGGGVGWEDVLAVADAAGQGEDFLRWLAGHPAAVGVRVRVALADGEAVLGASEALAERLAGVRWRGPVSVEGQVGEAEGKLRAAVRAAAPAGAQGCWEVAGRQVWFEKRAGQALQVSASGVLGEQEVGEAWVVEGVEVEGRSGGAGLALALEQMVWREGQAGPVGALEDLEVGALVEGLGVSAAAGRWEAAGVEGWLGCLPTVGAWLAEREVVLEGDAGGRFRLAGGEGGVGAWEAAVDLEGLGAQAGGAERPVWAFEKARGERAAVKATGVGGRLEAEAQVGDWRLEVARGVGGGEGQGCDGAEAGAWEFRLAGGELEALRRYWAGGFDEAGRLRLGADRLADLRGALGVSGRLTADDSLYRVGFEVEAGASGFSWLRGAGEAGEDTWEVLWAKEAGSACRMSVEVGFSRQHGASGGPGAWLNVCSTPMLVVVESLEVATAVGGLAAEGELAVETGGYAERPWWELSRQGKLALGCWVTTGEGLALALPWTAGWVEGWALAGRGRLTGEFGWDLQDGETVWGRGVVDMTEVGLAGVLSDAGSGQGWPVSKAAGLAATVGFDVAAGQAESGAEVAGGNILSLNELRLTVGENEVRARGELVAEGAGEGWLRATVEAGALEALAGCVGPLEAMGVRGRLAGEVAVRRGGGAEPAWTWRAAGVDGLVEAEAAGRQVGLVVAADEVGAGGVSGCEATVWAGEDRLTLAGDVSRGEGVGWRGRVEVLGKRLDVDGLESWAARLGQDEAVARVVAGVRGVEPAEVVASAGEGELAGWAVSVLEAARASELRGGWDLGEVVVTDGATGALLELEAVRGRCEVKGGQLSAGLRAGLAGGTVAVAVGSDLREADPVVRQQVEARQLGARPSLSPLVESEFPGLKVTGRISQRKELEARLLGLLSGEAGWQGQGVTRLEEGALYGPGGPAWLMRLFGGLRLVEYRWEEMTSVFELETSGWKWNEVTFVGEGMETDIYLTGATWPVVAGEDYEAMASALAADREQAEAEAEALAAGSWELSEGKAAVVRERAAVLDAAWSRQRAGERLRGSRAEYVVGFLVSGASEGVFVSPAVWWRTPIFVTRSYIVGNQAVGLETAGAPLGHFEPGE